MLEWGVSTFWAVWSLSAQPRVRLWVRPACRPSCRLLQAVRLEAPAARVGEVKEGAAHEVPNFTVPSPGINQKPGSGSKRKWQGMAGLVALVNEMTILEKSLGPPSSSTGALVMGIGGPPLTMFKYTPEN